ncbi:hypothetical protein HOF92_12950 [bacterium]|jgi:flagellar basal body-associated protein FliL|nr:hypothetical protein [bacterium]
MADENQEENSSKEETGGKFSVASIKAKLQNLDYKDRKVQAGIGGIALAFLVVLYFLVFTTGEEKIILGANAGSKEDAIEVTLVRPVAYITLSGADPKDTELRATIKDEDKVMNFSITLGLEKKTLKLEILKRMAPLVSETLRYLSMKSKDDILDMIQDPKQVERRKMLSRLNYVMQISGEERMDLNSEGRIVQINFVKFYFPGI